MFEDGQMLVTLAKSYREFEVSLTTKKISLVINIEERAKHWSINRYIKFSFPYFKKCKLRPNFCFFNIINLESRPMKLISWSIKLTLIKSINK